MKSSFTIPELTARMKAEHPEFAEKQALEIIDEKYHIENLPFRYSSRLAEAEGISWYYVRKCARLKNALL